MRARGGWELSRRRSRRRRSRTKPHDRTLDDGNLARFVADGCLTVRTTLPTDFHSDLYGRIDQVFEKEGNPGNNLLPRLPEIRQVFDDPAAAAAVCRRGEGPGLC